MKKHNSLLLKFALIFLTFTVVTLLISGAATYVNQTGIYHAQQERNLQNIAVYLSAVIAADGDDFPIYSHLSGVFHLPLPGDGCSGGLYRHRGLPGGL